MTESVSYEIRVQGHLSSQWADWFDGLTLENRPDGSATLAGTFPDQARLYGVLDCLRDLGLTLLAVSRLPDPRGHFAPLRTTSGR